MLMERRKHPRESVSAANSVAWLRLGERLYPTLIVNEANDGIGMTISQKLPVDINQFVVVERLRHYAEAMAGVIRHFTCLSDDRWYVGVEWVRNDRPALVKEVAAAASS